MLMSAGGQPATLIYGHNGFRVVRPGKFVICAVTDEAIALEELRYWSVERQEAYAGCRIATLRLTGEA